MTNPVFRNPFRPGAGHMPPYLAGREDETEQFLRLLEQDVILDNMVLTGIRGVGKTVLMDTWRPAALESGWQWAGNDLSEVSTLSEDALAVRLIADLAVAISSVVIGRETVARLEMFNDMDPLFRRFDYPALAGIWDRTPGLASDKLRAVLETVWEGIKDSGVRGIVFAYDEAQNLVNHGGQDQHPAALLLDVFQSMQRRGVPFMLLLSGLPTLFPRLVEERTFAERMFRAVGLDRLDPESCREAVIKPIESSGCPVRFTDESVDVIYNATRGYPYFVQFFCRESFDVWMVNSEVPIPVGDIQRKLDSDFFAGRWYRATDRQRDLLWVVASLENSSEEFSLQDVVQASAKLDRPFSGSTAGQMLAALCDAGLVYRNRRGRYSLAVPLLDDFILRQM